MKLLAIDCAANLCAACVYDAAAGKELGRSVRDLGKGHAEHLMAVIDEALKAGGTDYAGLGAVAVSVGPGSFTGLRVGVSAARGLALALKIPAIGVTTLEALAAEASGGISRPPGPGRARCRPRGDPCRVLRCGSDFALWSGGDHTCASRGNGGGQSSGACRHGG